MLATYYRGRTSFIDLMNLPLSYINALYRIAENREKTQQGQEQHMGEQIEDEMEAAVT